MVQSRVQHIPLGSPVIKGKVLEIAKNFEVSDFCASNGWLDQEKQRYEISFQQIFGGNGLWGCSLFNKRL